MSDRPKEGPTVTTLVRHVMTQAPETMTSTMTACDAAETMANFDVGVVPIVDDGHVLVGLVTDRDLVHVGPEPEGHP
jgi:CBS domain-containing protein